MNCDEAQELFGLMSDMSDHHPKRRLFEQHLATCSDCAAEFEFWEESHHLFLALEEDVSEDRAEEMNRKVMDRIYRESPWLIPDRSKPFAVPAGTRKRLSLWISSFVLVFLCSALYFVVFNKSGAKKTADAPFTGIMPTGIADATSQATDHISYNIPAANSGIIDPLVVSMGPTHPQYWMILSALGVAMALFSLRRLSRQRDGSR